MYTVHSVTHLADRLHDALGAESPGAVAKAAGIPVARLKQLLSPTHVPAEADQAVLVELERVLPVGAGELFDAAGFADEAGLLRLSARIRQRRSELELSARELARRASVSASYVSVLERGLNPKTQRPTRPAPTALQQVAVALQLPAEELLSLAGYDLQAQTTEIPIEPFAKSVETETLPVVLRDLLEMERDYSTYLDSHLVAQTPVLVFLAALATAPDIRVVGVTFGTTSKPARAISLKKTIVDRDPEDGSTWEGLRISVLGKYMTANALLLDFLRRRDFEISVDRDVATARKNGKATEIAFVYSTDAQLALLRHGAHDLAIVPNHPYLDRQLRLTAMEVHDLPFDPWAEFRSAALPLNVVVTLAQALDDARMRSHVLSLLELIRSTNRSVKSSQESALLAALASDRAVASPAVDLNEDVYIRDAEAAVGRLAVLASLSSRVSLTRQFKAEELQRYVVPIDAIRRREVLRVA